MIDPLLKEEITANARRALAEDIGAGDLSAELVPAGLTIKARVMARTSGILCGQAWFDECFAQLDRDGATPTRIVWQAEEGASLAPGQTLCELEGAARALLSGERSALNFLQMLSGVASKTRQCVNTVADTRARIVDTRKTLPGLRLAQKYAVRTGGGGNHRLALWDAILIKENHILAAGGIRAALHAALQIAQKNPRCRFVQIEVENLAEMEAALAAGATMLLLDNFDLPALARAVQLNRGRAVLEASGGLTLADLRAVAATGIDRISIGALTKDVQAFDLSLLFLADCGGQGTSRIPAARL
ncbi:MAG: carboxylating nicotinate-nucleotide diphosphorylase [Zoogloeaceae bacterium]|jgi:nicotinate-nucleotide pyrophosphorylase (carboxylating)|nr:carboxylating nicotinate-nucleotide diphosphorylase [Zoogloeaceae bacterium]